MPEKYQNIELKINKIQIVKVIVQLPEEIAEDLGDIKKDVGAKKMQAVIASLCDLESKQPTRPIETQYSVLDINLHPEQKLPCKFILSRERIEEHLSNKVDSDD